MEDEEQSVLLERAKNCAKQVGKLYMDWYREGPFFKELAEDKAIFLNDSDFRAGLAPCLYWELKKLGLWNPIEDGDWETVCDLAMKSAWDRLQAVQNQA